MRLSFHGAARSVTGSRHLVEANGQRVLLDCGLVQGHGSHSNHRNHLDFDPRSIDAVVLSHAHIDHSGALPLLVRHGYNGPIYATPATAELTQVMLADSAFLHEQDALEFNVREDLTGPSCRQPLYTSVDAAQAASQMVSRPYGIPFDVAEGITVTFRDAGHILGSAFVQMDVLDAGRRRRLVFTGDIGRPTLPVVRPPDPPEYAETLIMESTYGDRDHAPQPHVEETLGKIVSQVAEHGGKILIPAFAIGRTQQLTYMLNNLWNHAEIPEVPVYVDSPLAMKATEIFRKHAELWPDAMAQEMDSCHDPDPFGFGMLRYIGNAEESRALNDHIGPAIIIAASGMCEGGRIVHHLANHLQNHHNVVLLVGYQAEGTMGRRLLNGERHFTIQGREVECHATILQMSALSAHADRTELHAFYSRYAKHNKDLFVVHGEPTAAEAFAGWSRQHSCAHVAVPALGEHFDV